MGLRKIWNKYGAKSVVIDNLRFDSQKEGRRYLELKLLLFQGVIRDLAIQPSFDLFVKNIKICTYKGDFAYLENDVRIIEDVKGFKTPVYKLKKKLMKAIHGIEIRET